MLFEKANKLKVRFETNKGNVTTEDLWDMPLVSTTGFSLDAIAISLNRKLKETEEESFVAKRSKSNTLLELKKRGDANKVKLQWFTQDELEIMYPNIKTYKKALFCPSFSSFCAF